MRGEEKAGAAGLSEGSSAPKTAAAPLYWSWDWAGGRGQGQRDQFTVCHS